VLLFVLLCLLTVRQIGSLDAGFHLKAGNYILTGHGWPHLDSFTYTLTDHSYTDTSWGFQVLLALAERLAGPPGMVILITCIVLGIFLLLYRTMRLGPSDPTTLILLIGIAMVACEMRYEVRPELLSCLFLASLLHLLNRHALGLTTPLWLLPALSLLWANCHALFVLGWVALICVNAGLWLKDGRPDRRLMLWSGAAFLAPLLNPYGLKGVLFPFSLLTRFQSGNPFSESIGEFVSPFALRLSDAYPFYPHWPIWAFRLVTILAVWALLPLIKQRKYWSLLLCAAFFSLSAKMIRNMPLFVIAGLPAINWALPVSGLWTALGMRAVPARRRRLAVVGITAFLAMVLGLRVLTGAYYVSSRRPDRFGWQWNERVLPVTAARHIRKTGMRGPMLNHLNLGGYLMWAQPEPVFIDGRLEVVGEKFYDDYRNILSSAESLDLAARRYGFRYVILPYAVAPRLLGQLSTDPFWKLAYVDPLAVIFVRKDAPTGGEDAASVEQQAPPTTSELSALPGLGPVPRRSAILRWLSGCIAQTEFPTEDYNLGLFHYFRREYPQAEARFRTAIQHGGEDYYEIYLNLGSALYQQKKYDEAARCYKVVLQEDPRNKVARSRLAAGGGRDSPQHAIPLAATPSGHAQ
jgi:hypothetical protein